MALSQDEQKQYEELEKQIGMANQTGDFDRADELSESQQKLGSIYPVFAHSFDDDDATPPVLFHVQMIADGRTLIEIVKSVTGVR